MQVPDSITDEEAILLGDILRCGYYYTCLTCILRSGLGLYDAWRCVNSIHVAGWHYGGQWEILTVFSFQLEDLAM
jgi:hypothetical protein